MNISPSNCWLQNDVWKKYAYHTHTVLQSVSLSTSATLCPGESWKSCWRCFFQSEFWHTRQVAQVIWHMPLMGHATQCPACMHHHASIQFYPVLILVPLLGGRVHIPLMGCAYISGFSCGRPMLSTPFHYLHLPGPIEWAGPLRQSAAGYPWHSTWQQGLILDQKWAPEAWHWNHLHPQFCRRRHACPARPNFPMFVRVLAVLLWTAVSMTGPSANVWLPQSQPHTRHGETNPEWMNEWMKRDIQPASRSCG